MLTIDSPQILLGSYAVALDAYTRARDRLNAYTSGLSASDMVEPSRAVRDRLEDLEDRYRLAIADMLDVEPLAMETIRLFGAGVNSGAVKVGGRLFQLLQAEDDDEPSIVVTKMADVIDGDR